MVHLLEVVKDKARPYKEIYPYAIQELRPTLNVLENSIPEELDLHKVQTPLDGSKDLLLLLFDLNSC